MSARDLLRTGALGLRTRKGRAALSALGIAIGIASMVAVLGISASSRADLLAQLDALGTNGLRVQAGQGFFGEDAALPPTGARSVRGMDGVQAAAAATAVEGVTVRRTDRVDAAETGGISVLAADPGYAAVLGGRLAAGRGLGAALRSQPAVVLGAVAAARLGGSVADGSERVLVGGRWLAVVGILRAMPLAPDVDRSALVGVPYARAALDAPEEPTSVVLRADDDAVDDVRDVLGAQLAPDAPEEVDVSRPSDALAAKAAAQGAFTALLLGLGAVALLVGGVGIANVMVIGVLERRSEVGLRRALGATRRHVSLQFLCEAVLLAALGGLAGAALGALVTAGYATAQGWSLALPATALAGGVGSALAIGALAGLYPAARAARLSPTDALRGT